MGAKLSKLKKLKKLNPWFNFGLGVLDIVSTSLDLADDSSKEIESKLNRNLDAINRNYDAIREVGSKVDRNLNVMVSMFEKNERALKQMEMNIRKEFDALKKFIVEKEIRSMASKATLIIEQFMDKKKLIQDLIDEELLAFLESPNGLIWLETSKEILYENIHFLITNYWDYLMPKDANDEIKFKTIQVLLLSFHAYFESNLDLIQSYRYIAEYFYSLNDLDRFSKYISNASLTIKNFKIILFGSDRKGGIIEKIRNILEEIKQLDFIQNDRMDIKIYLSKAQSNIDKLKTKFDELKQFVDLVENKPFNGLDYDFSRSNIHTPLGKNWVDNQAVSYAIQYRNKTDLSLISDWAIPYVISGKACPHLKLNDLLDVDEKLIFRKFESNKPELVATIKKRNQVEFRDINRDLFNSIMMNANLELAIKNFNFLIKNGADVDATFVNDKSLIHFVIEKNKLELSKLLVDNHANINLADSNGLKPIHLATQLGFIEQIKFLINNGVDVNSKMVSNWTPFLIACKKGNENVAKFLLENKANITQTTKNNFNAWHIVCSSDESENMINFLSQFKELDINSKSTIGLTPLHMAIIGDYENRVKLLLEQESIDVNVMIKELSPLHFTILNGGNLDILKLLLEDKRTKINTYSTIDILQMTISMKKENIALELLKREEIRIDSRNRLKNEKNLNHLRLSIMNRMNKVAKELLKLIEIESRDADNANALHYAAQYGNLEILKFLIIEQRSISLNVRQRNGNTPLILATLNNHLDIVKFLVEEGARIYDQNEDFHKAIDFAASNGNEEIFMYLKEKGCKDKTYLASPLRLALLKCRFNIVQIIIEEYPSIFYLDKNYYGIMSFLGYAALGGNVDCFRYLLSKNKCSPYTRYNLYEINNTLDKSASSGNYQLFRYHYSLLANHEINDSNVIYTALGSKAWPIVEFMVKSGKYEKSIMSLYESYKGAIFSPLCGDNQRELINYFLDKFKFDVNKADELDRTCLFHAVKNGHLSLIKFLVEQKNANYTTSDTYGNKLLDFAIEHGKLEILKYLVEKTTLKLNATHLNRSSKYNQLEILKYLTQKGLNINEYYDGRTPLLIAAHLGNWEIVEFLIENNANTELRDYQNNSIIHEIAKSDRIDIMNLLQNKAITKDSNFYNNQHETPIFNSARNGQYEMTKYLVEILNQTIDQNVDQINPIHLAAASNDLKTLVYLVDRFEEFSNLIDARNFTPIDKTLNLEIAKYLIEKKNVPYDKNFTQCLASSKLGILKYHIETDGYKPPEDTLIDAAKEGSELRTFQYLIENRKMDIHVRDGDGRDATFYIKKKILKNYFNEIDNDPKNIFYIYKNNEEALRYEDAQAIDYYFEKRMPGLSPTSMLSIASSMDISFVRVALKYGADIYQGDDSRCIPLGHSCASDRQEIVKFYFFEKNMDINYPIYYNYIIGSTCLHIAARQGHFELVKYLVENHANVHLKDGKSRTPLDLAIENGNKEIEDYLRSHMSNSRQKRTVQMNYPQIDPTLTQNPIMIDQISESNKNFALQNVDLNSTLMLFDVMIRKLTDEKIINQYEQDPLSLLDAKLIAIDILSSLEKHIEKLSKKISIDLNSFDPTKLISNLTWKLRNGKLNEIHQLLISFVTETYSILNSNSNPEAYDQLVRIIKKILIKNLKPFLSRKKNQNSTDSFKSV